jgi:hypothetical protein
LPRTGEDYGWLPLSLLLGAVVCLIAGLVFVRSSIRQKSS